jgi:Tfp pilus assembly protein PilN
MADHELRLASLDVAGEPAEPPRGRKEVDLYDPSLFVLQRELAPWAPLAVMAVALLVGTGITAWMHAERTALAARLQQSDAQVAALRPDPKAGDVDSARDKALQAEVARMRARLEQLSAPPGAQQVSAVLEGLAAATLDGVWLTRIQFDRPARQLSLEGRTRDARLLPRYLQSLGRQPVFAGLPLATVSASRPDPQQVAGAGGSAIQFKIVSSGTLGDPDPTLQRAGEPTPPAPTGGTPGTPAPASARPAASPAATPGGPS